MRRDGWTAIGVYLLLTLAWHHNTLAHMESHCACGLPGDPSLFIWSFTWFPHALLNGLNPFYTHAIYFPSGTDLAANTQIPLVAMVMSPLTWLWGPIASFNLATIAAPALNAWAANRLCRYVSDAPWASMLAGVVYGFGTYVVGQSEGHMQLFVVVVPPLLVLCTLRYLNGEIGKRAFVALMALMLTAQLFISTEVLFTTSVLGFVALGLGWAVSDESQRLRLRALPGPLALAYLLTLIVSSYYLYEMLQYPPAAANAGLLFPTDLLSFVIPEPYTWLGGGPLKGVSAPLPGPLGNPSETDAYLGIPLILIVISYLRRSWAEPRARLLAGVFAVTVIWMLGGTLAVDGHHTIWLPYRLFEHLPVFKQVLHGRLAAYLELGCAVVLALWLAQPSRRPWLRWLGAGLAAVAILPNLVDTYPANTGTWTNPAFFRTSVYKRYLAPGASILPIRWFGQYNESLMWQGEDNFYWNLADGANYPMPAAWKMVTIQGELWLDTPTHGIGSQTRAYLIQHHVSDVVVSPDEQWRWSGLLAEAGLHWIHVGGVYLYRVPYVAAKGAR